MSSSDEILIRRDGAAGRITLNRPRALNALTHGMCVEMGKALTEWRDDPAVKFVIVDGAGERGLCAGGDIRSLHSSGLAKDGEAAKFWADEYRVNAMISRFPKPYIALMDGLVMGGGVGVSAHGNLRVVTERTALAMPEVAIGLFPDVGGTWLLSRAPGEVGTWAALTAERLGAADVIYAGMADICVPAGYLQDMIGELVDPATVDPKAVISRFAVAAGVSTLEERRTAIDAILSFDTVEECVAAARRAENGVGDAFIEALADKSPSSLKVTLAALRNARTLPSLEAVLEVEFRLAIHMLEAGDFFEGVRAAIIDKDRMPKWNPATLEAVTAADVATYFESLGAQDLRLVA